MAGSPLEDPICAIKMRNDGSRTRELVGRRESRGGFRNPERGGLAGAADGSHVSGEEQGCQEMALTLMHLRSRGCKYKRGSLAPRA